MIIVHFLYKLEYQAGLIEEECTSELPRFTIRHIIMFIIQPEYLILKEQQEKQVQNNQQKQQQQSIISSYLYKGIELDIAAILSLCSSKDRAEGRLTRSCNSFKRTFI
jgi:hypothetical protein